MVASFLVFGGVFLSFLSSVLSLREFWSSELFPASFCDICNVSVVLLPPFFLLELWVWTSVLSFSCALSPLCFVAYVSVSSDVYGLRMCLVRSVPSQFALSRVQLILFALVASAPLFSCLFLHLPLGLSLFLRCLIPLVPSPDVSRGAPSVACPSLMWCLTPISVFWGGVSLSGSGPHVICVSAFLVLFRFWVLVSPDCPPPSYFNVRSTSLTL